METTIEETLKPMTIRQQMAYFEELIEYSHPIRRYWALNGPRAILEEGQFSVPFDELIADLPNRLAAGYAESQGVSVDSTILFFFRAQCSELLAEELNEVVYRRTSVDETDEVQSLFNLD